MNSCSDQIVGQMLHAYELGMLEQDEEQQFEIHMIGCLHCRTKLAQGSDLVNAMKFDPDMIASTNRFGDDEYHHSAPWLARHYAVVTAMLLVLCLALTYPAYNWITDSSDGSRNVVPIDRRLTLLQKRSISDVQALKRVERVVLVVGWAGVVVGKEYDLTIARMGTHETYFHGPKTRFNDSGFAELLIEPNTLPIGDYVVRIRNSDGTGEWDDLPFRCE